MTLADVAAAEVRAARQAGAYQTTWHTIGRAPAGAALPGAIKAAPAMTAILRAIVAGKTTFAEISEGGHMDEVRVNSALKNLSLKGLIAGTRIGRGRNRYTVTPAGLAYLEART
jgi:predicted transcriptional regulator